MTKLSDTQSMILSAASRRPDLIAMPLPANLRGGAATKVVASMLANGLLEEVEANLRQGEAMWRETGDGHGVTLVATANGLAAIGIEDTTPKQAAQEATTKDADNEATEATDAPSVRRVRGGTKQAALVALLRRTEGATIAEIALVTAWQDHTIRGAMAGALKKAGLVVTSTKEAERGRVYRLPWPAA